MTIKAKKATSKLLPNTNQSMASRIYTDSNFYCGEPAYEKSNIEESEDYDHPASNFYIEWQPVRVLQLKRAGGQLVEVTKKKGKS